MNKFPSVSDYLGSNVHARSISALAFWTFFAPWSIRTGFAAKFLALWYKIRFLEGQMIAASLSRIVLLAIAWRRFHWAPTRSRQKDMNRRRSGGESVIWVPTPQALVTRCSTWPR